MPNPVRPLSAKMYHRLTKRQKSTVRTVRGSGLKVVAYRRKGNSSKLSVHNPFSDFQRKARLGETEKSVRRYPQAFDTYAQRSGKMPKYIRRNIAKGAHVKGKRIQKRGGIISQFFP